MMRSLAALAVLAAGMTALFGCASTQATCGSCPSATIENTTFCGVSAGSQINAFLGIRFATTDSIWAAPEPVSYDGAAVTEQVQSFRSVCLQPVSIKKKKKPINPLEKDTNTYLTGDQDCLFLNVWAPQGATRDTPVMVWIHGGAFVIGSAADNSFDLSNPHVDGHYVTYDPSATSHGTYDGTTLAETGVIVVSLNYRLGAPGFLASTDPKMTVPANLGLRDQQTAMAWVKKNIAQFTSEPNAGEQTGPITLFGESAGAMSVGLHLMGGIADSVPLFDRAIMESNPMGYYYKTPANADLEANLFFQCLLDVISGAVDPYKANSEEGQAADDDTLGCKDKDQRTFSDAEYQQLAAATADQVATAQVAFGVTELNALLSAMLIPGALPWSPVIDGSFVQQQPLGVEGSTPSPDKPYVFGFNDQEGALFAAAIQKGISKFGVLTPEAYAIILNRVMGQEASQAVRDYQDPAGDMPYSADTDFKVANLNNSGAAISAVINDFAFRCGNFYSARKVAGGTGSKSVYAYHFAPTDPQPYQVMGADLPACNAGNPDRFVCHTMEIPSVFGTFTAAHAGPGPSYLEASAITSEMSGLQGKMTTAWSNFAKSGDPTRAVPNGEQTVFPTWTPYTAGTGDANVLTMTDADNVAMQAFYDGANCAFWDETLFDKAPVTYTPGPLR